MKHHQEIADHLRYLIQAARKVSQTATGVLIPYDPKTKAIKGEGIPIFQLTLSKKEAPDTDLFRPENAGREEGACYEEAIIVNTAVQGKCIRWTPNREKYIREWGFYSSGMELQTILPVLMLG